MKIKEEMMVMMVALSDFVGQRVCCLYSYCATLLYCIVQQWM